jgi:hypothetical protein
MSSSKNEGPKSEIQTKMSAGAYMSHYRVLIRSLRSLLIVFL